jgi:hypothetical protein
MLCSEAPALAFRTRAEGRQVFEELESHCIRARIPLAARAWKALQTFLQSDLLSLLVTSVRDFYNPRNTAPETVVTFVRMPGKRPARRMVVDSPSGCLNIHSIFSISQEH